MSKRKADHLGGSRQGPQKRSTSKKNKHTEDVEEPEEEQVEEPEAPKRHYEPYADPTSKYPVPYLSIDEAISALDSGSCQINKRGQRSETSRTVLDENLLGR